MRSTVPPTAISPSVLASAHRRLPPSRQPAVSMVKPAGQPDHGKSDPTSPGWTIW